MQETGFNKIEVRTMPDEVYGARDRPGVGIQILIDDDVYTEGDDYYVNIESFFKALSEPEAVIEFIGGCHLSPCCANGAWTKLASDAWYWNDRRIRLSWPDICKVSAEMLDIITECTGRKEEVWTAEASRMEFYRKQLEYAETWATMT
ncbi:MAG: hypothetical protein JST01_18345 [Cyanobacteria bacterium SZAS TMP-1]|nr:hypothetical protein [Cyanobacteria bacterium SZAS TMP-1]